MAQYKELSFQDVRNLLSFCNPDADWEEYSAIGRSVFAALKDDGKSLFQEFTESGTGTFKQAKFNSRWNNFTKTRSFNEATLVYYAKLGGWESEKKEYSQEEKQEFARLRQARINEQKKRQDQLYEKQLSNLDEERSLFHSLPVINSAQHIGTYLTKKLLRNAFQFNNLRRFDETIHVKKAGERKAFSFRSQSTVRSIWSDLGNKGQFLGYEKLSDKAGKSGNQKFSSENAMTQIGFTSIGFDESKTKTVFVGGGYANCLIAHIVSGDCWVSPIGETNIVHIIERLRQKYPHIKFIAAPDNDKAGINVAHNSGGLYVLPKAEGADWWDVWNHEGDQALKSQLKDVNGFRVVESDTRYLQAAIQEGLNLFKAGMGTGKTTLVKQHIINNPDQRVLIISHRKTLAENLQIEINREAELRYQSLSAKEKLKKKPLKISHYEELINPEQPNDFYALQEAQCLVISVDSIYKLAGGGAYDFVFVDEIEQNICHTYAKTNTHSENNLNMINFFLIHSNTQVLADAHLGDLTKKFCAQIGLKSGVIYQNNFKSGVGKTINVYEDKNHLSEFLNQELLYGQKSYVFANSVKDVQNIETKLAMAKERNHFNGKVLVVYSGVKDQIKNELKNIRSLAPTLDVIVASPTLGTGFDIPAADHNFTNVYGFLNSMAGSAEEGHQGLNRARDIKEFHVFVDSAQRNEPTDPEFIKQKLIVERSKETSELLEIDPETGDYSARNTLYEWLYCEVKAKMNKSKNDYYGRFMELATEDGFEINHIDKDDFSSKFGKEARKVAKERNDRVSLRDISKAPLHTGDTLQAINNNAEGYSELEVAKSRIAFDLNVLDAAEHELDELSQLANETYAVFAKPGENFNVNQIDDAPVIKPKLEVDAIVNALTLNQFGNRYVDQIKKLSVIKLNKQTTLLLDKRDVSMGGSRVNWKHRSMQRAHKVEIFSNIGLSENLDYNGTYWSKEGLLNTLSKWLKNKTVQSNLFKYSGISVSDNMIANPVQWLNGYLNSHGIKTVALGKKRIVKGGPAVHTYGIDEESLAIAKTLVDLRVRGIEQSVMQREENEESYVNKYLVLQEVSEFVQYAAEESFTEAFKAKYMRLLEDVEPLREKAVLRAELTNVYDQVKARKSVPPLPPSLSNQVVQGGTVLFNGDANNTNVSSYFGESEKDKAAPPANLQIIKDRFSIIRDEVSDFINKIGTLAHDECKDTFERLMGEVIILTESKELKAKLTAAMTSIGNRTANQDAL